MTKKKTVRISRDKVLSTKDLIAEALIPEVKKKCFIHLGRKAMMNLDSVLKSRDTIIVFNIHLRVHIKMKKKKESRGIS